MQTATSDQPAGAFIAELRRALAARTSEAVARSPQDGTTLAGVLVPLFARSGHGDWHVLLNRRSTLVGQHKGEIAFPGGRREAADADMVTCALREAHEEMGIRPQDVRIVGTLDAVLTRTGYLVCPVVGVIPYPYRFVPDAREVAEVIEAPLSTLVDESARRHERRLRRAVTSRDGSGSGEHADRIAYAYGPHLIYGATAAILDQLLPLVRVAERPGGDGAAASGVPTP